MSKKDAAVYLKAAEEMDSGVAFGCCKAIANASLVDSYSSPLQERFADAFSPTIPKGISYWWTDGKDWNRPRVIALCFAAAMAEAGDL